MKKYFLISNLFLLGATMVQGQRTLPASYAPDAKVSYIRTWDALAPETDANTLQGRAVKDARMTTQYFDGLGRLLQTVVKQGSLVTNPSSPVSAAGAVDLVSSADYDEFGREQFKYLPSPANATGNNTHINDGFFKLNPFQQQAAFYSNTNQAVNPIANQGETFFYSQTNFEASPLNRITETFAPGNSWAGTATLPAEANHRSIKAKYWLNTTTDAVRIWNVSNGSIGTFGTYETSSIYPTGELFKNATVDEQGKQVIEFKDKEGKVILKKVQLTAAADEGPGRDHTGWLCTYYIYDNLGNLRCVMQPEGVKTLSNPSVNWQLSSIILNEQCFRYEYDNSSRMIVKKVPGAGEVYLVYDKRDRMVMSQDALMRIDNKWLVTKYDELNRPIETGLWATADAATALWIQGKTAALPFPVTGSNYEKLTETHYDDYSGLPAPLSNTYLATWNSHFAATSNSIWPYPQMPVQSIATLGLVTWSAVKVLGTSATFLYTASIYDDKGRVIQVQSTNEKGGTDVLTTQYSWAGQPLMLVQKQQITGASAQITTGVAKMNYDELGRLVKTEKKVANTNVNSGVMPAVYTITGQSEYNALGQLKKKAIGQQKDGSGNYTTTPIETLDYDYNIRGWMLGANREYARDLPEKQNNYFGFDLGYDKINNNLVGNQTYNAAQYNGNITGMVWKSKGDGEKRKYDFSYDGANRLLKGDFSQYTGSVFSQDAGVNYNIKIGDGANPDLSYDYNGNIKRMQQWGLKTTGSTQIDDMLYTYYTGTNKLQAVTEQNAGTADHKLGDFTDKNTTATDYGYDRNGNMVTDLNKNITGTTGVELGSGAITYNYLNLPQLITVADKGTITYTYDAAGNKLRKITTDNTVNPAKITTTDYIAGMVYENNALQFLGQEEGRIRLSTVNSQPVFVYDYMIKDHLGNVRMVLTEEQKIDKYPVASLEDAKITTEDDYYTIDNSKIVDVSSLFVPPPAYTNDNGIGNNPTDVGFETANSSKLYQLNATSNKTGLGITLKVMAGDRIDIHGTSYWNQENTGGSSVNAAPAVIDLLSGLLGSPSSAAGGKATATQLDGITEVNGPLGSFISQPGRNNSSYPGRPKAFINYIFLDEQFKMAGGGFSAVKADGGLKLDHFAELQNKVAPKNGYVYIYVSNESPVDVFFDNLQVVHTRGLILEETHYYPFGLKMSGISSKALNGVAENKAKFNSIEFNDDFDLNMYDAFYRNLDPQIGRFWQIDPRPNETFSVYSAMANNPIVFSDPLGDTTWLYSKNGQYMGMLADNLANQTHFLDVIPDEKASVADFSSLSIDDQTKYAKIFREKSIAFMGNNTLADMKTIVDAAIKSNKEVLFTGTVGKDKEIRLTAVRTSSGEYARLEDVDKILDASFTKEQQANMFLVGHVHQQKESTGGIIQTSGGNPLYHFGRPSSAINGDSGDYGPYLYRSATATQRGQSPALILSRYGFTVYGTASSKPKYESQIDEYVTEGKVEPSKESYFLYKQLKK